MSHNHSHSHGSDNSHGHSHEKKHKEKTEDHQFLLNEFSLHPQEYVYCRVVLLLLTFTFYREDTGWDTKQVAFVSIGILTFLYCIFELTGALYAHSLVLMSDGFHNLSDVISLGIAYWAQKVVYCIGHITRFSHCIFYDTIRPGRDPQVTLPPLVGEGMFAGIIRFPARCSPRRFFVFRGVTDLKYWVD